MWVLNSKIKANLTQTRKQQGFTIVETLIVLGVTGFLFLATSLLIRGQMNSYQQRDASLQLESVVRNIVTDVSNGYYPDTGLKISSCTTNGAKTQVTGVVLAAAGSNPGTSPDCVYAGKKISFNNTNITIDTLVTGGSRTTAPSALADLFVISQMSETRDYRWGVKPTTATGNPTIYVLNTAYSPQSSGGVFRSGAQNVGIFNAALGQINTDVKYCFENGGAKTALVIQGSSLQVAATTKDTTCS